MSADILKALTVAAELTGTELSKDGLSAMLDDLSTYPEPQVLEALHRCRKELKGRLTLADIISRIDDGRPGVESAWAMIPQDETSSCVWTKEMQEAFMTASPLLNQGDKIAARMAFKESYEKLLQQARTAGDPVRWSVSFGFDKQHREDVLLLAVDKGYFTLRKAQGLLPSSDKIMALGKDPQTLLEADPKVKKLVDTAKEILTSHVVTPEIIATVDVSKYLRV